MKPATNSPRPTTALTMMNGRFDRESPASEMRSYTGTSLSSFREPRLADTGRAVAADQLAVRVFAEHLVDKHVLRDDDVAFHPQHLGDVGDAARAVAQARRLHDHVDRGADHLADGLRGQRVA